MKIKKIALLVAVNMSSAPAFATNGMNLAGYGPVSESMGGVSAAYDNGNAGMINNPATLAMMQSGTSRFDIALGDLMPKVSSSGHDSSAKNFFMPAFGYVRKDGNFAWGAGVIPQGGMGTDYSNGQFWGTMSGFGTVGATPASLTTAQNTRRNMSEVGVGRLIFPLAYQVSDALNIGGSVDYVWAGMDAKWLIDGAHFADFVTGFGGQQRFGTASGSMVAALGGAGVTGLSYGYIDFEKSGKFFQQATSNGWAGNIGFTYKVSPALTIGGAYHAKTHLGDMTTKEGGATMTFSTNLFAGAPVPLSGKVTIHNFQWPETYSLGFSYKANPQWTVNADYKRINWASVMQSLKMTFAADGSAGNGGFANTSVDIEYFQRWKNQDVLQLGAEYKPSDALTLRFGTNIANNPIPDQFVSPLFPAIYKTHYTFGFGYAFSKASSFDFSYVYTPKVSVTNSAGAVGGSNQNISVGGGGWTAMYSYRF